MIYEARIRLSAGKRKWMFTLSRNGRTIFVSDHSYHTRGERDPRRAPPGGR